MEALYHSLTPAQQEKFLNGPALAPPPGVVPNFDDPPNGNALCYSVLLLSLVISTAIVLVRMCATIFCVKKFRLEDFFMVASLAIYAGFAYIVWICYIHPESFVHQWNIRVKDLEPFFMNINTACILYGVALLLLKVAIFLDWIHIFTGSQGIRGGFYWGCIANIVVNFIFYTTTIFVMIFACTPRSKIWNRFEKGKCIDIFAVNVASSVFNFILDLVMLSMPQRIIWKLQLSTKKKVALSLLFAVGVFGCICGALRIVYSIPFMKSPDKSYNVSSFALSGLGEMTAGFLVLCIPSIPKLVKNTAFLAKILRKVQFWMSSYSGSQTKHSRMGLPSWIRAQGEPHTARRRPEDTTLSEPDEGNRTTVSVHHEKSQPTVNEKAGVLGDGQNNSSVEFIILTSVHAQA